MTQSSQKLTSLSAASIHTSGTQGDPVPPPATSIFLQTASYLLDVHALKVRESCPAFGSYVYAQGRGAWHQLQQYNCFITNYSAGRTSLPPPLPSLPLPPLSLSLCPVSSPTLPYSTIAAVKRISFATYNYSSITQPVYPFLLPPPPPPLSVPSPSSPSLPLPPSLPPSPPPSLPHTLSKDAYQFTCRQQL